MSDRKMSILSLCKISLCFVAFFYSYQETTAQEYRTLDGYGNNLANKTWGASGDNQIRLTQAHYTDGFGQPVSTDEEGRPNPRYISNRLFDQKDKISDPLNHSDFAWMFGQFIDHDITLVENGREVLTNIVIPEDDKVFTPGSVMYVSRNKVADGTGLDASNPRQYTNEITSYIDGSAIYGSDDKRANWLRSFEGGKLKTSPGNLLPWNTVTGNFNDVIDYEAPHMVDDTRSLIKYYVAGDVRANENPLLLSMHTLFVREHNRQCDALANENPSWDDETLYQNARARIIAILQHIVYYEWLPSLGVQLSPYSGYKTDVDAKIFNEFSAAAFRFGHTLINSNIIRIDNDGNELKSGNISLRDAFFNPQSINFAGGIDAYIRGMAQQVQQEFDCKLVDDVRNFLFGGPGSPGLDLAAININRGRDRGLLPFNIMRNQLGLPKYYDFSDLTNSQEDAAALEEVYSDVDNIDAWVGMLAEKKEKNSMFGKVVNVIVKKQFQVLRDGDRFYYENNQFDDATMAELKATTMRSLIMRNTDIDLMQDQVFTAMPRVNIEEGPELTPFALDAVIYPNPVQDNLHIKLYGDVLENVTINVIDNLGRSVCKRIVHVYQGLNYVDIPVVNLPRGYYNVVLENSRRIKVLKMIKEH